MAVDYEVCAFAAFASWGARAFLDKNKGMNATPKVFAVHHARNLAAARQKPEPPAHMIAEGDDEGPLTNPAGFNG